MESHNNGEGHINLETFGKNSTPEEVALIKQELSKIFNFTGQKIGEDFQALLDAFAFDKSLLEKIVKKFQ